MESNGKRDEQYLNALRQVEVWNQELEDYLFQNNLDALVYPTGLGSGARVPYIAAVVVSQL